MKYTLTFLTALFSLACSDDGSALQGIYQLDTWTESEMGCTTEGPSVLDTSGLTHLYIKEVDFFGQSFLFASLCVDLADCRERGTDDETIDLGANSYSFESGSDSSGWTGDGYIIGGSGGTCSGEVFSFRLSDEGDGVVRIENEITEVNDIPNDSEGFCDSDAAQEAAEGMPCARWEVLTGTFLESV